VEGELPFECLDASRATGAVGGVTGAGVATAMCAEGYESSYCGSCADTYYDASLVPGSLNCLTCGASPSDKALIEFMIFAALLTIGLIFAAVVLLSSSHLTAVVEVLTMTQEVVTIVKGSIDRVPESWTFVRNVVGLLSVINWELDVVKPGCVIPFLSYADIYYTTLILTVLSFFVFAIGAYVRASFIYAKIKWTKRNRGKSFPSFWTWAVSKLPCRRKSDDHNSRKFDDIHDEIEVVQQVPAASLALALQPNDVETDAADFLDDAEAKAADATCRKYMARAYPLPPSIAATATDDGDWCVDVMPYDKDAYVGDLNLIAAAARRRPNTAVALQWLPPPPPPPPPPPEGTMPPPQAEMKMTKVVAESETPSEETDSLTAATTMPADKFDEKPTTEKRGVMACLKAKWKEKRKKKEKVDVTKLLEQYSFSELFYRRFVHSTLILGWLMYLRVSTLTCK
jgi:hypothetical protein